MQSENIRKITDIAAYAGKILLGCGADIVRVEDTVRHIMTSYGIKDFEIFTLTNGIFLTSSDGDATIEGKPSAHLKVFNIPLISTNLGKLDMVNTLSRRIAAGGVTPDEAYDELCRIDSSPHNKTLFRLLASAAASGSLCYMFGGSLFDSCASFAVGFLYYILVIKLNEKKLSRLLVNIICGAVLSVLSFLFVKVGFGHSMNRIIVGAIMPLVPGVSFTNAIRDITASDYISGMVRLTDALVVAVGIAVGVGASVGVLNFFGLYAG